MEVVIVDDRSQGGQMVSSAICSRFKLEPLSVLGLATGSSPEPVYDDLAARYAKGEVSFRRGQAFLLDEYVGLPSGHPESYRAVIERQVVDRLDFEPTSVRGPDGAATDLTAACATYEAAIAEAGGVSIQLLGIGSDGHIGFNEPGSSLASRTRIKTLTADTRRANSRFFHGDPGAVPHHVITQGIGTILRARHLILLAWGTDKAEALASAIEGPVTASIPASALQLHPHVTVVADHEATSRLTRLDYYLETWRAKPEWQTI